MFEPKVPALGAAAGFVLSFLIGLFSGVPFSLILIRAIMMAVFFAVLSVGAFFLLKNFLPELLGSSTLAFSDSFDNQGAVDIVIEDPSSDILSSESNDSGFQNQVMPDFVTSEEKSQKSVILSGDEESTTVNSVSTESESRKPSTDEAIKKNEFIPGIHVASVSSNGDKNKPSHSVDGLDVLPDLDDFAPPTSSGDNTPAEESEPFDLPSKSGMSFLSDSENASSSNEAATMAKAIRTILAREG